MGNLERGTKSGDEKRGGARVKLMICTFTRAEATRIHRRARGSRQIEAQSVAEWKWLLYTVHVSS